MESQRKDPELMASMNEMVKRAKREVKEDEAKELRKVLEARSEAVKSKNKGNGKESSEA